ncbi:methyl-accepting chemotaxis protein [Vibrio rotiferianus]|uniref:Chemotaxis protein n=1 Tax=Vibrio rotiferianus TaxID=190895 RepID=A0A510I6B6_9VIBR|nr:methyl-accepting chemotaxis protein [Vibrio rotiferianus]PIB17891.1 methyl-accepting chemotaxis protein [Vibrio rotiferianus CAIM 577 = LMG 21460]BBL87976.1 chemotaxis protein [Vibrio rotiferianus]CAH1550982.1 Methyl-accepting chemotaxis protein [Vibrio rotiferianus]
MKFSTQVKGWVVFASIVPVLVALLVSVYSSTNSLNTLNEERLVALRDTKQARLDELFDRYQNNTSAVAKVVATNIHQLFSDDFHRLLTDLNRELDFYDIFIVDEAGDVIYTVAREADYQTNLVAGAYSNSGLGDVYRAVRSGKQFAAVDFAPYAPSNGDPAAFLAVPLKVDGKQWMVATQMSIDGINQLMNLRSGMGESGETYLVGADFRMRSNSFLDPVGRTIQASFAGTVANNGVDSDAVKLALAGESGVETIIDYNGNPVVSAYSPIDMYGHRWALLSEIDVSEAEQPIKELMTLNGIVLFLAVIGGIGVALIVTRAVMKPLGGEPEEMKQLMNQLAQGDLRLNISQAEEGSLKQTLNTTASNLTVMIKDISDASSQLAATSEELSVVTEQSEQSLHVQNDELQQAVTAIHQMTTSITEVAGSASSVSVSAADANQDCQQELQRIVQTVNTVSGLVEQVDEGNSNVVQLAEQVREISTLLDVIRGVADQTNLLALNAAIEAARAGESGRGFAVVAEEVRNLAQRTQVSTEQIEEMVHKVNQQAEQTEAIIDNCKLVAGQTMEQVQETGTMIEAVVGTMEQIHRQTSSVSQATEEQAKVSGGIDSSLVTIQDLATQNVSGAHETSASSRELARVAVNLKEIVDDFKV